MIEFAMAHQREYQLITSGLLPRINAQRPGFELLKRRSAEWLGGSPQDHTRLVLAVFSLVHGTVMFLITKTAPKGIDNELLSALNTTLGVVIQNRERYEQSPDGLKNA